MSIYTRGIRTIICVFINDYIYTSHIKCIYIQLYEFLYLCIPREEIAVSLLPSYLDLNFEVIKNLIILNMETVTK